VVSLLDVLTEADWLTNFHTDFRSIATRENITGDELRNGPQSGQLAVAW
jgi:hypothetical protein